MKEIRDKIAGEIIKAVSWSGDCSILKDDALEYADDILAIEVEGRTIYKCPEDYDCGAIDCKDCKYNQNTATIADLVSQ